MNNDEIYKLIDLAKNEWVQARNEYGAKIGIPTRYGTMFPQMMRQGNVYSCMECGLSSDDKAEITNHKCNLSMRLVNIIESLISGKR